MIFITINCSCKIEKICNRNNKVNPLHYVVKISRLIFTRKFWLFVLQSKCSQCATMYDKKVPVLPSCEKPCHWLWVMLNSGVTRKKACYSFHPFLLSCVFQTNAFFDFSNKMLHAPKNLMIMTKCFGGNIYRQKCFKPHSQQGLLAETFILSHLQ